MEVGGRKAQEVSNSAAAEVGGGEEEERGDDKKKGSNSSAYYECSFCRRGFTNAQALGGHMNIHRKDKPKSKSMSRSKAPPPPPPPQILPQTRALMPEPHTNVYMTTYMFSSLPYCHPNNDIGFHGEHQDLGFDLSLQIGPSITAHHREQSDDGDSLDLELRLGRPSTP